MIKAPQNVTALPGETASFTCLALSFGVLMYEWKRYDGNNLPQNAIKSYVHNAFPNLHNKTITFSLTIFNVIPSDEGSYCCIAINERGSTMECAWLESFSKLTCL